VADDMEHWFEVNKLHHPNEQTLFSLRRGLHEAGFSDPRVWIDADVLRSGNYRYTSSLDSPLMQLATRAASTQPSPASASWAASRSRVSPPPQSPWFARSYSRP